MAAVTGTVTRVFGFTTPGGPASTSAGAAIESCFIEVTFAGTYASADDSSTANVHTAIANARRDGRTYALISAGWAGLGDLNGSKMGANVVATSTNTMTAQLLQSDLSTEWANGALSTAWNNGVIFFVTYTAS